MALASFAEQRPVTELLQRSLQRGRLAHAYLFTGGDPAVLENVARNLAKVLLCENRSGTPAERLPDACDTCAVCRRVEAGQHPDVLWIRPESKSRTIGIDSVREIIHTASLKPTEARWKVTVIVNAERMNVQAANAFLKTLEEPPGDSVFILLSLQPHLLLETILSRCLRLTFSGAGREHLDPAQVEWIESLAEQLAQPPRSLLARYQVLGHLLAKLGDTRATIAKALEERSPLERYGDAEPKLRERWEEELQAAVEAEYRRQRSDLVESMLWFFRDVWLCTLGVPAALLALPQIQSGAEKLAQRLNPAAASENLRVLLRTQRLLETNAQEALVLEVGLLKLHL